MKRQFLTLLSLLILAGCVSSQKRFEQGLDLQAQGRFEEACDRFIKVLEKDRDRADAIDALAGAGPRAVDQLLADARDFENSEEYAEALGRVDRIDRLIARATGVGVDIRRPEDLDEFRLRVNRAGIDRIVRRAEGHVLRGEWSDALERYAEAIESFDMPAERRADLDRARADVYLSWADDEIADGAFISAYEKAGEAVALLDLLNDEREQEARELQAVAFSRGVRRLAVVPFWQTADWERTAPRDFRADLNDAVAFGGLVEQPTFLVLDDAATVRRLVRDRNLARQVLDRRDLSDIGRSLGVEFVLGGEMVEWERNERVRKEERRSARTRGRGGVDTTYVRIDLELRFAASLEYRVVDSSTRSILHEDRVESSVRDRFNRARFDGDWTRLDLSGSEQRRFDLEEHVQQEQELAQRLADELAKAVLAATNTEIMRRLR